MKSKNVQKVSRMWRKIDTSDYTICCREPIELRNLKRKLASLACNCTACKKTRSSTTEFLLNKKDQQVQAHESQRLFDRCTHANPQVISDAHDVFVKTITKDVLCPSCFITMSLLRGGILRVLKDEEVETNWEMFSSEKSTEQNVKTINKSTSFLDYSSKCSNVAMCDLLNEVSSDRALSEDKQHQVKFMESENDSQKIDLSCLCLDKFINSIRPPLHDYVFE